MPTVEITGWICGFEKVECTKLLRSELGLNLAEAKQITESILEDQHQTLAVPSLETGKNLAEALRSLGAIAHVDDHG